MSRTSTSPRRTTVFAGAALATLTAIGALTTGTAAAGHTDGSGASELAKAAPRIRWSDRDVILAQLQSEYLLEIAQSWYEGPGSPRPAMQTERDRILAQLQSEYLRGIARSWYAVPVDPTSVAEAADQATTHAVDDE